MHASTGLTPLYVNLARHPQVLTFLSVSRPTAPRGFTLGGNEGDKHWSSASHGILSVNVVTRSKAKAAVLIKRCVVSPFAQWSEQTLIDPSSSMRSPTAIYMLIESVQPIDDMAVSELKL